MLPRTPAALICLILLAAPALAAETRCGWLQNPTPGNLWLDDSQGTWILSTQGLEDEPLGMENIPDFSERDFVRSNGNYGYACACLKVESDKASRHITAVYSFRQLALSKCSKDKALPSPE